MDLTGRLFGRLTAIEPIRVENHTHWRCRCDCGNEVIVITSNLMRGNSTSCGCRRREVLSENGERARAHSISRHCRRCDQSFLATPKQRFCSEYCADRYHVERKWPKQPHHCPVCGVEFLGRAERIYCGDRCKRIAGNRAKIERRDGTVAQQIIMIDRTLCGRMTNDE